MEGKAEEPFGEAVGVWGASAAEEPEEPEEADAAEACGRLSVSTALLGQVMNITTYPSHFLRQRRCVRILGSVVVWRPTANPDRGTVRTVSWVLHVTRCSTADIRTVTVCLDVSGSARFNVNQIRRYRAKLHQPPMKDNTDIGQQSVAKAVSFTPSPLAPSQPSSLISKLIHKGCMEPRIEAGDVSLPCQSAQ